MVCKIGECLFVFFIMESLGDDDQQSTSQSDSIVSQINKHLLKLHLFNNN